MSTRKTLPYTTFDDLHAGREYRVYRHGCDDWVVGVLAEEKQSIDGMLWLVLRTSKTRAVWISAAEIGWSDGWPQMQLLTPIV